MRAERAQDPLQHQRERHEPAEDFVRDVLEEKHWMAPGNEEALEDEDAAYLHDDDANLAVELDGEVARRRFQNHCVWIEEVAVALFIELISQGIVSGNMKGE